MKKATCAFVLALLTIPSGFVGYTAGFTLRNRGWIGEEPEAALAFMALGAVAPWIAAIVMRERMARVVALSWKELFMNATRVGCLGLLSIPGLLVGYLVAALLAEIADAPQNVPPAPLAFVGMALGAAAPWIAAHRIRQRRTKENSLFQSPPSTEVIKDQSERKPLIPRSAPVPNSAIAKSAVSDMALMPFIAVPMLVRYLFSMMYALVGFNGWIWITVIAALVSAGSEGADVAVMVLILMFGLPYAIIRWFIKLSYGQWQTNGRHEWVENSIQFNQYLGDIATYRCVHCKKEVQSSPMSLGLARLDCPGREKFRYSFNKDLRAKHPMQTSAIAARITDKRRDFLTDENLEEINHSFWIPYLTALFLFGMITDGIRNSDSGIAQVLGVALVISAAWRAFWHFTLTGIALAFFMFAFSLGIVLSGRDAIAITFIVVAFIASLFGVVYAFMRLWNKMFGPD